MKQRSFHGQLEPLDEEEPPAEATMKILLPRRGLDQLPGTPTLRVVAGPDLLRYVPLIPGDSIVIGRDESCGLQLSDASVSRRHARVSCDRSGRVFVEDYGSTNGTRINGHPLSHKELRVGDQLEIGTVLLRLSQLSVDELSHLERIQSRLQTAGRDPLTGLKTRAWMEQDLPTVAERYQRSRLPLSVIYLDLDHFKSINDRFGHAVGDEVLRTAGRLMMLSVRDSDVCVRYGGEELVVFLPGTRRDRAAEIAERIRESLEGHDWSRTSANLRVTASFGVAEHRPGEAIEGWLERADRALYAAKSGGRNQVLLAA